MKNKYFEAYIVNRNAIVPSLLAELLFTITNHNEKRGLVFLGSETPKNDQL